MILYNEFCIGLAIILCTCFYNRYKILDNESSIFGLPVISCTYFYNRYMTLDDEFCFGLAIILCTCFYNIYIERSIMTFLFLDWQISLVIGSRIDKILEVKQQHHDI